MRNWSQADLAERLDDVRQTVNAGNWQIPRSEFASGLQNRPPHPGRSKKFLKQNQKRKQKSEYLCLLYLAIKQASGRPLLLQHHTPIQCCLKSAERHLLRR